jgi:hypothetical protein
LRVDGSEAGPGGEILTPGAVTPEDAETRKVGWRTRRGLVAAVVGAAAVLLAGVFFAGYALGRSGGSAPVTAATAPSMTAAGTPTAGSTGPTSAPTTQLTPLPAGPSPTPGASLPATSSTAIPASGSPAFEAFTSAECVLAAAPDYTCTTILVAQFTGGGSAAQYTAQVTFAGTGVTVAASTDGKPPASVFQLATSGSFGVSMGELSFATTGSYAYTVRVTDTADGQSATWQGTLPVGS